jgi:hypothetical protein
LSILDKKKFQNSKIPKFSQIVLVVEIEKVVPKTQKSLGPGTRD